MNKNVIYTQTKIWQVSGTEIYSGSKDILKEAIHDEEN